MKSHAGAENMGVAGRTPQGVRGLKFEKVPPPLCGARSHPARGAWIEIVSEIYHFPRRAVAPRKGCVD